MVHHFSQVPKAASLGLIPSGAGSDRDLQTQSRWLHGGLRHGRKESQSLVPQRSFLAGTWVRTRSNWWNWLMGSREKLKSVFVESCKLNLRSVASNVITVTMTMPSGSKWNILGTFLPSCMAVEILTACWTGLPSREPNAETLQSLQQSRWNTSCSCLNHLKPPVSSVGKPGNPPFFHHSDGW